METHLLTASSHGSARPLDHDNCGLPQSPAIFCQAPTKPSKSRNPSTIRYFRLKIIFEKAPINSTRSAKIEPEDKKALEELLQGLCFQ